MRIAGGHCPDCFRTFSATTEGLLALEDSDGREVFVLTSDEREQLGHIVHDADFVQALEQPFVWRCEAPSDVSVDLEVHWQDGASQSARVSDGCFGRCNQPTHPFMRLKVLLFALKERYVACGPNRWRSQEPCGVAPQPPPGGRMLCAVCVDDCGVPLPEGSRTELDPDVCDVPCDAGVKGPCFADCVPFQYPDAGQNAGGP